MPHITVSDVSPRQSFAVGATPSSGPFALPSGFVVFDPSEDLKVYNGTTLLTYASSPANASQWGFTGTLIDGGYQGGTINLGGTVSNTTIVVVRDIPIKRLTDYPYPSATLDLAGLNTEFDRLTAIFQDRESRDNRTIRQPDADVTDLNALPVAALRANAALGFDATGQVALLTSVATIPLPVAVNQGGTGATTAAAAFAALKQPASETDTGVAEIATQTETNTGSDDARIVTPLKLAAYAPPWATVTVDTASDLVAIKDVSDANKLKFVTAASLGPPRRGYISGLIQSNSATDPYNDIDISAGECRDATNSVDMILTATLTKRLDAVWAAGTNQGGLDTGAKASYAWYALWLIRRSDTGAVDALFSTSFTAPTMPASYDSKRLIGAVVTDLSANIREFKAAETAGGGLHVDWSVPSLDVNAARTTTRTNYYIAVPPRQVIAHVANGAQDSNSVFQWLSNPDLVDTAPVFSGSGLHNSNGGIIAGGMMDLWVLTDASGRVALDSSGASGSWYIRTWGYIDHRRV